MKNFKERAHLIYMLIGVILLLEMFGLFYNSGIIPELNERAVRAKVYGIASRDNATILPGDILDRNKTPIATTTYQDLQIFDEEGNPAVNKEGEVITKSFMVTEYVHGKAYTQLIGYTKWNSLQFFADSIETIEGEREDYRLMKFLAELSEQSNTQSEEESTEVVEEQSKKEKERMELEEKLHTDDILGKGGLYETIDIHGTKGQSAILTLDNDLQIMVYEALKTQMSESETKGSAVVLDAKTGEILAMVSFPTYDLNLFSLGTSGRDFVGGSNAAVELYQAKPELEAYYPITTKNPEAPGSIFKIFMCICLIDHGMEDFTVKDEPFVIGDKTFDNAYTSQGDKINYIQALERSSNVFFSKAALELGEDRIRETAEKFGFLENSEFTDENKDDKDDENPMYYILNFGSVTYNWDLTLSSKNMTKEAYDIAFQKMLASTGFGQGKTEWTTLSAAMVTQTIANDGKMIKPYLVQSLVDANGKVVYENKPEVYLEATSKSTANKVTKAMLKSAEHATDRKGFEDVAKVFEKYQVAGKTGTAEIGPPEKLENNAWFVSFAPADDPQYVVVVNQCKTDKAGYHMTTTVADIYEYLFEKY